MLCSKTKFYIENFELGWEFGFLSHNKPAEKLLYGDVFAYGVMGVKNLTSS